MSTVRGTELQLWANRCKLSCWRKTCSAEEWRELARKTDWKRLRPISNLLDTYNSSLRLRQSLTIRNVFLQFSFVSYPQINWHTIYWSFGMQFLFSVFVLKYSYGSDALFWLQEKLNKYFDSAKTSSAFLFGESWKDHEFIFGVSIIDGCLNLKH